ncbi:hypothetical protein BH11MYX2_BH11MYX2_40820 [soil metagenome]
MRSLWVLGVLAIGCGGGSTDPHLIAGGGVGGGDIGGTLNVFVIDTQTYIPIVNAMVHVGADTKMTDEQGLVSFDVSGKQTVAVKADGYRSSAWIGVNGVNVTMPMTALSASAPPQATLSGTVEGWAQDLPAGHIKATLVTYSQTDEVGSNENSLSTPANMNICLGVAQCAWSVVARTGKVTIIGATIDRDGKGTVSDTDDTNTVIGWSYKADLTVEDGINQSGIVLAPVEAGNLQDVTVDLGAPPAALTQHNALIGIETTNGDGDKNLVQLPLFLNTDQTHMLTPKPAVFDPDGTYRLTAIANTATVDSAQSIVLRQKLVGTALAAGAWLQPPTGVTVSRSHAAFDLVDGAIGHSVQWDSAQGQTVLEITAFDGTHDFDVPALLDLPAGTYKARVQAIAADFKVNDFSLDDDADQLHGISAQPATVN